MMYAWLADGVLLLHLGFILFVVLGGLLLPRWPRLVWLHLPAALWGALIEFRGWICPLTPLENHHYPWLPVGWLLRDRYDSVANLAGFAGRVAVLLAQEDRIVPAKYGQALFASLGGSKRLWLLPGAEHNDWWLHTDEEWGKEILEFLLPP